MEMPYTGQLVKSLGKVVGGRREREGGGQGELQVDQSAAKFTLILQEIPGCSDVAVEDVNEWLNLDAEDVGFQLFNDDEIVSHALNKDEVDVSLEEEDAEDEDSTVSHFEAFYALQKAFCWYEIQEECVSTKYLVLKQLRGMAALKRQSSHIQTKITDFFKEQDLFIHCANLFPHMHLPVPVFVFVK